MRIGLGSFLLIPVLAGCVSPPAAGAAAEGVLRAVLAHEARSEALNSYGSVCVYRTLEGVGLDQFRALRWMEEAAHRDDSPADREAGMAGWSRPGLGAGGPPEPIAPAQDARLAGASATLLSAEARPAWAALRAEWIPAPLTPAGLFKRLLRRCSGSLTLSNPAIAGPFAFVDVAFDCGGLCGFEMVIALERRGASWTVVGERLTLES